MEFIEQCATVERSEDETERDDVAGGDEVNQLGLDFIDDKINFQDQGPTDYCCMNVTKDLQEAIVDRSMAFDLDLVAVDFENFVSDFVDEVSYEFHKFLVLKNASKSLMKNLKILNLSKNIPFTFLYSALSIIIFWRKRKILISSKMRKDCMKFWNEIFLKS